MQKISRLENYTVKAIFAAVIIVQTVLAVWWAAENIASVQLFAESDRYISAAESQWSNGWQLIGYSAVLSVLQKVAFNGYTVLLYILQAAGLLATLFYTIQVMSKRILKIEMAAGTAFIGGWYIITIPILWQMVFAVLPDVLCLTLFLLELDMVVEAVWGERRYLFYRMAVLLLISFVFGLTDYKYFYASLLVFAAYAIYETVRDIKHKDWMYLGAVCLLMVAVVIGTRTTVMLNRKTTGEGSYIAYSIPASLADRFVYSGIADDYSAYSEELQAAVSHEDVMNYQEKLEYMKEVVGPKIDSSMGVQQAKNIYWEMVQKGFELRKKSILVRLGKDVTAHTFQPLLMFKYMYNNNYSRYGYNYKNMWQNSPVLTKKYMHFGMNAAMGIVLYGILATIVNLFRRDREQRKNWATVAVIAFAGIGYTVIATILSPEGADYRLGIPMTVFWLLCSVLLLLPNKAGENGYDQKPEKNPNS